jgi:NAD-dependent SIR2 family protein deacetylase
VETYGRGQSQPQPGHAPDHGLGPALDLLTGRRVVALTGAGLSTDSGIPDYRGPDSPPRSPMTYGEFVSGVEAQQRYWARSHVGWRTMGTAHPNAGHRALAALEAAGVVHALITQNVDGLHTEAGSRQVVDLHGRISDVLCLGCGDRSSRAVLDERLGDLNPGFAEQGFVEVAPDGDAVLSDVSGFRLAPCSVCGGPLKPDVVFFGENVPKDRVARCYALVEDADVLLVAGTSLTVQSGLRFVRRAHAHGIPVVLVNRGATRGDPMVTVRLDAGCSEVLSSLADVLAGPAGSPAPRSVPDRARTA